MSIEVSETQTTKFATTVHVVIRQDGRDCVVGYVNLADLEETRGASFDTKWTLDPPATPVSLPALERNDSSDWIRYTIPYSWRGWYNLYSLVHFMFPTSLSRPSMSEEWITPTDPRNRWTNDAVGMLVDLWPPFIENYYPDSNVTHSRILEIARQQKQDPHGRSELMARLAKAGWTSPFILTTTSMTLEIKRRLPPEGVKWLFVRAQSKLIEKGSFDIEVVVLDEAQRLVAISHQTAVAAEFRAVRGQRLPTPSPMAKI